MEFKAGGYWHYAMVMPDGQSFWSRLDYQSIAPIDGYVALDGFSDETGAVNPELPRARWDVAFAGTQDQTTVTTVIQYNSAQDVQKVIDMGLPRSPSQTHRGHR